LGMRSCGRRRSRSVITIALLASGCFVIASIGVFRLDSAREATQKNSGTGGFTLIADSSMPVLHDLNSKAGREFFGLDETAFRGITVVPFRVHQGDEASCLNLNRAQKPRLLGVRSESLSGRFTFSDVISGGDREHGWQLLSTNSALRIPNSAVEEIPAIGDASSIQYALGKKIGDTIDYTDEHGHIFKLRLVGALANSILQGSLIIDESQFVKRFPSESGHRFFLLDTPPGQETRVSSMLSKALQDQGFEATSAVKRLDEFNAVQNTYLGTFQILGGLGLLVGSAGVGIVLLRNVLERRGELAVLLAAGFRRRRLRTLLLTEHSALLGFGLALGILAAAVAVLPAILARGQLPYFSLGLTLAAILANGFAWTWFATHLALRGNLLNALRNE
jgi:putative ABC transport system permease protein